MQKLPILLAAALSVGVFAGCEGEAEIDTAAPDATPRAEMRDDATVDPGADLGEAEAQTAAEKIADVGEMMPDSIYEVLAETTEAALTAGGFDDMLERFAENDRNRFGEFADAELERIDSSVRDARSAWQTKYQSEFDIDDPAAVFRPLVDIQPGPTTDDKVWATVMVKQAGDQPGFSLKMVKDVTWHIDVDDNYDRQSLREAVARHLAILKDQNQLPDGSLEGQRMVARHILAALANTGASGARESATPGS